MHPNPNPNPNLNPNPHPNPNQVQLLEDALHPAKPDLSEEPSKEERDAMLKWEETQECIAGNIEESKHIEQKAEEQRWWAARWEATFGLPDGGWGAGGPEELGSVELMAKLSAQVRSLVITPQPKP